MQLAFAMTINNAQGQTFDRVGVWLERPVSTHGQLYVALSRVRGKGSLFVKLPRGVSTTKNVVYRGAITGEQRPPPAADMDIDRHHGPQRQHEGDVDFADEYALGEENDEEDFYDDL